MVQLKIYAAMLALREFTVAQLSELAIANIQTTQTVIRRSRKKGYIEKSGAEQTRKKGGQPAIYRLVEDAVPEIEAIIDSTTASSAQWQSSLEDRIDSIEGKLLNVPDGHLTPTRIQRQLLELQGIQENERLSRLLSRDSDSARRVEILRSYGNVLLEPENAKSRADLNRALAITDSDNSRLTLLARYVSLAKSNAAQIGEAVPKDSAFLLRKLRRFIWEAAADELAREVINGRFESEFSTIFLRESVPILISEWGPDDPSGALGNMLEIASQFRCTEAAHPLAMLLQHGEELEPGLYKRCLKTISSLGRVRQHKSLFEDGIENADLVDVAFGCLHKYDPRVANENVAATIERSLIRKSDASSFFVSELISTLFTGVLGSGDAKMQFVFDCIRQIPPSRVSEFLTLIQEQGFLVDLETESNEEICLVDSTVKPLGMVVGSCESSSLGAETVAAVEAHTARAGLGAPKDLLGELERAYAAA